MPHFEASIQVACMPQEVFDFLVNPQNAVRVTSDDVGLRLLEAPERIELGSRLTFELSGFGPSQRMVHEVVEFEPPRRFTENQVEGPLSKFVHEHLVETDGEGRSVIVDRIEFEPPGGMLGFLVTEERIRSSLNSSFRHRHAEMKRLLEGP